MLASGALDRLKAHATTDGPEQLPGHVADAMIGAGLAALDQLDTLGPPDAIYAPAIGEGPGGRWYQVWPRDLRPKK